MKRLRSITFNVSNPTKIKKQKQFTHNTKSVLVTYYIQVDANSLKTFILFAKFQSESPVLDKTENTLYLTLFLEF